jgi:hypothetical protein
MSASLPRPLSLFATSPNANDAPSSPAQTTLAHVLNGSIEPGLYGAILAHPQDPAESAASILAHARNPKIAASLPPHAASTPLPPQY